MTFDWTTIATAVTGGALVLLAAFAGFFYWGLLGQSVRHGDAQVYFRVLDSLQAKPVRQARARLLAMPDKEFPRWTRQEKADAEVVCQSYDSVGIMIAAGMLKPRAVIPHWHNSIHRCWEKASPMISVYRATRGSDYWDDFEELFKSALEHETTLPVPVVAVAPMSSGSGDHSSPLGYRRAIWVASSPAVACALLAGAWYAHQRWRRRGRLEH